jgi:hypothetical protein
MGMRYCGHVPNTPRNKNPKRNISYLLEKVVFLEPKRLLCPLGRSKKNFSSTLNVMISQMKRNESVRFGRHIDIEVSYKILQLEIQKLVPILHYPACFQKGLFGCSFEQKHLLSFWNQKIKFSEEYGQFIKKNITPSVPNYLSGLIGTQILRNL